MEYSVAHISAYQWSGGGRLQSSTERCHIFFEGARDSLDSFFSQSCFYSTYTISSDRNSIQSLKQIYINLNRILRLFLDSIQSLRHFARKILWHGPISIKLSLWQGDQGRAWKGGVRKVCGEYVVGIWGEDVDWRVPGSQGTFDHYINWPPAPPPAPSCHHIRTLSQDYHSETAPLPQLNIEPTSLNKFSGRNGKWPNEAANKIGVICIKLSNIAFDTLTKRQTCWIWSKL